MVKGAENKENGKECTKASIDSKELRNRTLRSVDR